MKIVPRESIEPTHLLPVAHALAAEWNIDPSQLEFVRVFHNLVYRYRDAKGARYLRITPDSHRSESEILSELHFVRALASAEISVALPVPTDGGGSVCSIEHEGERYHGALFEEAPGRPFIEIAADAPPPRALIHEIGRTMGKLHRIARDYVRPEGFERFGWIEDRWDRFAVHVPRSEVEAWRMYEELMAWCAAQPRDDRRFGLIHGDFTIVNFRIDGARITLFDFDACCDHWRAYELAIFLHYFGGASRDRRAIIYDALLDGYASETTLDAIMIAQIPLFAKMRLLYSFLVFAEEWGFEGLNEEQERYFALRRSAFTAPSSWHPI